MTGAPDLNIPTCKESKSEEAERPNDFFLLKPSHQMKRSTGRRVVTRPAGLFCRQRPCFMDASVRPDGTISLTDNVSRSAQASGCALILECHCCPAKNTPSTHLVQPRFLSSEERPSREAV